MRLKGLALEMEMFSGGMEMFSCGMERFSAGDGNV